MTPRPAMTAGVRGRAKLGGLALLDAAMRRSSVRLRRAARLLHVRGGEQSAPRRIEINGGVEMVVGQDVAQQVQILARCDGEPASVRVRGAYSLSPQLPSDLRALPYSPPNVWGESG